MVLCFELLRCVPRKAVHGSAEEEGEDEKLLYGSTFDDLMHASAAWGPAISQIIAQLADEYGYHSKDEDAEMAGSVVRTTRG